MPHDVTVLTEPELRRVVHLDAAAVRVVEKAFAALASGRVVMPPILSMAIPMLLVALFGSRVGIGNFIYQERGHG